MSAMEIEQQAPNAIQDEPAVTGIIYPPPDIRSMNYPINAKSFLD